MVSIRRQLQKQWQQLEQQCFQTIETEKEQLSELPLQEHVRLKF
jgi:hypothetical protein